MYKNLNNQYRISELPPLGTVVKEEKVIFLTIIIKQENAVYKVRKAPIILTFVIKKIIASLKMPRPTSRFLTRGTTICNALTNDSEGYFGVQPVNPTIAEVEEFLKDLKDANQDVKEKVKGAVGERAAKRVIASDGLLALKYYVQKIANADVENALAIVTSASMLVKGGNKANNKAALSAKNIKNALGSILINAKSKGRGIIYAWEVSLDNETFTAITPTKNCKTILRDQVEGQKLYFRYRVLKDGVYGKYSVLASVVVG
jgi:hypothetical protein